MPNANNFPREEIIKRLINPRREEDGSILSDCPICEGEAKGKGKKKLKLFAPDSISDVQFVCFRGGAGDHIKRVLEACGLDPTERSRAFLHADVFGEQLRIEVRPAKRGPHQVKIRACGDVAEKGEVIASHAFDLSNAKHRIQFIKKLSPHLGGYGETEMVELDTALMRLGDRFDRAREAAEVPDEGGDVEVSFKRFDDGTLLEQVRDGFAVYSPATKKTTHVPGFTTDGVTYAPVSDPDGLVRFAGRVIEYYDEARLDAEIEAYILTRVWTNVT